MKTLKKGNGFLTACTKKKDSYLEYMKNPKVKCQDFSMIFGYE